jgi:hypothetical protein
VYHGDQPARHSQAQRNSTANVCIEEKLDKILDVLVEIQRAGAANVVLAYDVGADR